MKNTKISFSLLYPHRELIFAIIGGLCLVTGFLFDRSGLSSWAIFFYLWAFSIGGFYKAKEGVLDLVKDRSLNVEILMIIAAIGAASIGYWGEGAILIFIFSLSGALETYTLQKSEQDLTKLMKLAPEEATILKDNGRTETVAVENLQIGDRILVKPGERIPADGVIITGNSLVDEATITGESMPVTKSKADDVFNGTINGSGSMTIKVSKRNADSLFQKMITLVQQAKSSRPPSQQFIERIEGPYVLIVLLVVTFMLIVPPLFLGTPFQETFYRAMVLLVVASPCAVVASVMPALLSAISTGARHSILVKEGLYLEQLSKTCVVAFDKTGTLTLGKPEVTGVYAMNDEQLPMILASLAAIEQHSNHPLARAIHHYCKQKTEVFPKVNAIEDVPGYGVKAEINGVEWRIGRKNFLNISNSSEIFKEVNMKITDLEQAGHTFVFVSRNDTFITFIALKDKVRPQAASTIDALSKIGLTTIMITGDQHTTAQSIAKEIGVDGFISECLPEQKVKEVERLREKYGSVVMVGDGVNDAPALAQANTGIAMGSGTDVAIDTADIVLMNNELEKITLSFQLSKRLNRVVKQNLIFSVAVILLLLTANFAQQLTLPLGVIGHEGSTLVVILNGLRLLRTGKSKASKTTESEAAVYGS
ncbi:heavy metal translocating P-type ATPase [Alteribacter populi]|uniref:heavy metal translocating P-type ATPase n=1 Tax=Alteribacter populi TaxID=2011011 RepID=UPI000BBB46DE|nr:heavy metal translocating P-type ATPase [Alteribacter populi]